MFNLSVHIQPFLLMPLKMKFDYGFKDDEQKGFDVIDEKCAYR